MANLDHYVCLSCGKIVEGGYPPESCPSCGTPEKIGEIKMTKLEHYVCLGCGLIVEGGDPPENCPICGAPQRAFYPRQYMPKVEITLPSKKEVPAAPTHGEKHWVCLGCGHIDNGEIPPEQCPICKAPQEMFKPRHLITK